MEARYQRIFDASPVPMQIHAYTDGNLVAINHAHEQSFGYALSEISGSDAWFDAAFDDPAQRFEIRQRWLDDARLARASGRVIDAPQGLRLRCKDGAERIVRGSMTVIGDDIIVSWTDLTEIRKGERSLLESERRFRGMVEQTITGFYVVQHDRVAYVNRSAADTLGYAPEAIIGRDPLAFVLPEDAAIAESGRAQLAAQGSTTAYQLRCVRGDGTIVVVGIHAAAGTWDDQPAMVAVMEDITERTNAREKLAGYVRRLETSMQGTLHAVAHMVDLRDPYTAGHQRRVGLISADIARALGWPEARAAVMTLIGLVHDIGKIAVPAELLTKPSRLTPIEFELIKGHAQASYDILKDVQFDFPVADIIVQHHERLDGSGYPNGLKGDQISIEGRVLAVADVLESMASHRPYRPALGIDAALAELERGKGGSYDPEVVDTVAHMIRDHGYALPA